MKVQAAGTEIEFESWRPFYTLLKREVLRFLAVSLQTVVAPIVSASLYLLVFGVTLGQRVSVLEDFSYAQFVIPGLALMGVITNSFANTSSSLFMSRYLGGIADFLVAPLTPPHFIMAYTLAAMFRGLLVGAVVLVVSTFFAGLPWPDPGKALLMAAIASFLFSQLGLIAAILSNGFDALSMYTNFLILPLVYLGGLFYPVSELPSPWSQISMGNPLFYLIDGFRRSALGIGDVSYEWSFGVATFFAVGLFIFAATLITKGYRLRS